MKIGIIGLGFVGDAMKYGCENFGFNDIVVYDPIKLPGSKIDDLIDTDISFVCVPTPMGAGGKIDDSIVCNVIESLNNIRYKGIISIKSTLVPTSVNKIIELFRYLKITTNPEFLTERSARQDFVNSKWVVVGGKREYTSVLKEFYEKMFKSAKIVEVTAEAAMMAKYMTNTWFAVKVSLMNEFYDLWSKMSECGIKGSWDEVVGAFSSDDRVGPTHLQVPGPDGDYGFGGKCFPKDLNAIKSLSVAFDAVHNVMNAAWDDNKKFRKNKDWLNIDGAVSESYKEE